MILNIDYKNRVLGLDVLRAFAIITVVYNHGWIYSEKFMDRETYDYFHFDGVSLFFVLSGFLIGGIIFSIIEKHGSSVKTLKDFWIRRWFRTLPLYYLVLIILVVKASFSFYSIFEFAPYIKYFFFSQNFFSLRNEFFLVSWSLAVEEWFYIILPLCVWLLTGPFKIGIKTAIPWLVVIFVIVCLTARALKFNMYEADTLAGMPLKDRYPFTVIGRLDSLMYGILAAYVFRYLRFLWDNYKKLFFSVGMIIILVDYVFFNHKVFLDSNSINFIWYRNVLHYSVLPLAAAFILPFLYDLKMNFKISKVFIFISIISYSLYLSHLTIVAIFKWPVHTTNALHIADEYKYIFQYMFYWVFSILISTLLYKYFEKPMTDMRERLTKAEA